MWRILLIIALLPSIPGFIVIAMAFKRMHKYFMIRDTPTSTIRSMAIGLVEINGRAEADVYIGTKHSGAACVYYRYKLQEYQEVETEDGTSYQWVTIGRGSDHIPFTARDETGTVHVNPAGADFHVPKKLIAYRTSSGGEPAINIVTALRVWLFKKKIEFNRSSTGYYIFLPDEKHLLAPSVGDRRSHEHFIEPEGFVYIMGTAKIDRTVMNNVSISKGVNEPTFIIANKPEDELLSELRWKMSGFFILGFTLIALGFGMVFHYLITG